MTISAAYRICPAEGPEPDYREIISDANLRRRLGRIVRMGVAAGLECMRQVPGAGIDAVIASTALGCIADTEKFLSETVTRKEAMLNPSSFIYSTFNTVAGQIALMKGLKGYNMTYADGGLSFRSALTDAYMCLSEGMQNVLVVAYDETSLSVKTVFERLGRRYIDSDEAMGFIISSCRPGVSLDLPSFLDDAASGIDHRDMAGNITLARALYDMYKSAAV